MPPNSVGELVGHLGRERQHEMAIERRGQSGEGIDPVLRATALLQSRDHRLGCAHALGQLALTEPCFGSQVIDKLSEVEIELCRG